MSSRPTLPDTEPPDERLAKLACPSCGYRPIDDVEPPANYEEALDWFDCGGAAEEHVFCNQVQRDKKGRDIHCGCEFNPETGHVVEDDDFAEL